MRGIYETSNEDSFLKSFGPFRIFTTDNSIAGASKGEKKIYRALVESEISIYGEIIANINYNPDILERQLC